jgi:hypothetical protein
MHYFRQSTANIEKLFDLLPEVANNELSINDLMLASDWGYRKVIEMLGTAAPDAHMVW